ncbi:prolyl-tRNA synthetase [Nitzschia inconspicua]|uniref:proline--tRNA ligase n=1 Tax=Nitzschia inconspicua TaxID=303405 RepID=A0A9K3PEP2_9STRA|nr:prolyl-tRNA synthetase [Nitzschia inconspicua]
MPLVAYSCSASSPGILALKILAEVQETKVEFSEVAGTPSLTIVTNNPVLKTSDTSTAVSWLGCARALAQTVPSLALWDVPTVESWVESATTMVLPSLESSDNSGKVLVEEFLAKVETHFNESKEKYIAGSFTAADICLAVWLAQALIKCDISIAEGSVSEWMKVVLSALKSCDESGISPLWASISGTDAAASSSSCELTDNPLVKKLQEFRLEFDVYLHSACMSAEELLSNVPLASDKETHTKNLFFKDKKHGLFLVTHATASTFNTKQLGKLLNLEGKTNFRLADEATLDKHLAVKPGCVGPLCIVNDGVKEVKLVLDKTLTDGTYDFIHSHPLRNDASVKLKPAALMEYLSKAGIEPAIVDMSAEPAGEDSGGKAPANRPPASKGKGLTDQPKPQKQNNQNKKSGEKGKTLLRLQWKKSENFPMWYSDVIVLSEMISYYDISGCYILRPWSYKIWELMQQWFNEEILKLGVDNCYFPLFVSQDRLEKEKDHVEGFAPEVAWVTKSGESELAQQIAIRPTSETIMYPAFSDWIKSHRDLPLKLNQWSNVVRWEFKFPTPFLRSREFLWQEGHTAHATYEEADEMVMQALDLYRKVYQDLLCVPVIPGYKTKKEKFAGGHQTTTVEAYIPASGRAIQGATSHNLGQNFGKMFDIKFQDTNGESQIAWQTSWGLTTRTIGVMVMVHGDDIGLVMPPRVAPVQVVIVPVLSKNLSMEAAGPYCIKIKNDLESQGLRAKYDDRDMYNPGWKYNHWEQKGVPIRLEVGPADIEKNQARVALRYNGEKMDVSVDGLGVFIKDKLDIIQKAMFEKAVKERDQHVAKITEWKDFVPNLEKNNLVLTPWCGGEHEEWEEWVKKTSKEESLKNLGQEGEDERTATSVAAKTLCIPFDQPDLPEGTKCIASGLPATCWVLWGRSY